MRVPLRWLEELIDLPTEDPEELAAVLTALGHEVEGIERLGADWTGVVVGRVAAIEPHPRADRVRVCQVDTGSGPGQIICGAWNFEEGAYVPVALPGAVLPGGFEIARREIRGVVSNGMICSERELGLGDDHAGILVLDAEAKLGSPFSDLVELPDVVFDLSIGPNRPDAMSMVGVARDLAAYYDTEFRMPDSSVETVAGSTRLRVEIADPSGCRRFTAREITGVDPGRAPMWLRHRLHKAGMRSISAVVDVTNYVMLELGHPLHAFDADRIVDDRLIIRRAAEGETLVTLDGQERDLVPDDLIIYDGAGPTSMSGTMGGERSEVTDATTRVIMEAASWDPPTIMYMSRRHDLRSEASLRFERGVDPELANVANRRACRLVAAITGGEVLEGAVDEIAGDLSPIVVDLRLAEVERLLGPGVPPGDVPAILLRLGMGVEGDDPLRVTVPTFRPDVTRPADLVEEVARIYGYDRFQPSLPTGPAGGLDVRQWRLRRLHSSLAGAGLSQAVSLPFVSVADLGRLGVRANSEGLLAVKNPLREEESRLRPTLLPGMLSALRRNHSYGATSVALFETGRVFTIRPDPSDPRLPFQPRRLGWAVIGELGAVRAEGPLSLAVWRRIAADMGVKAEIRAGHAPGYHPGRTAVVEVDGGVIGHVGELSPLAARAWELPGRVAIGELDLDPLLDPAPPAQGSTPSVFPHVDFDLSFRLPDGAPAADLVAATSAAAGDLLESARVFDEFRGESVGEGARALAIRYRLRAMDRTLTGEEIAAVRARMISAASAIDAELRGA